jgi:hypothetical protein
MTAEGTVGAPTCLLHKAPTPDASRIPASYSKKRADFLIRKFSQIGESLLRLRVVDASILPRIVGANTMLPPS